VATLELVIDGQTFVVEVGDVSRSPVTVNVNGVAKTVSFTEVAAAVPAPAAAPAAPQAAAAPAPAPAPSPAPAPAAAPVAAGAGELVAAPMPGKILSVLVTVGQKVNKGDTLCTLEAMKMEMPVSTVVAGTVTAVHVQAGQTVANDAPLVTIG
jgi:biotin carboxyl carrier protein